MDIKESLLRYGTDKPDLRYDLEITDLGSVLAGTKAQIFRGALDAGGVVRGMRVPGGRDMARRDLDELVTVAKGAGGKGLAWLPGSSIDKFLTAKSWRASSSATGAGDDDLVLVVADRRRKAETVMGLIRQEVARRRKLIREDEWKFLWINPTYLFEEDDEGKLTYAHHPVHAAVRRGHVVCRASGRMTCAPTHTTSCCNGYELGGGSLRIYDPAMQEQVFQLLGMPLEIDPRTVRNSAARIHVRRAAAWGHRAGHRPHRDDARRHRQHSRRHRISEDAVDVGPDARCAVRGRRRRSSKSFASRSFHPPKPSS